MKRKLKWLAIVLAVLLVGFGTALFLWPRDRITKASWEKIRIGMTEKEVEGILSGPGKSLGRPGQGWDNTKRGEKVWLGRRGSILISFKNGVVIGKFWEKDDYGPTFVDRLRDWLGW
ncbi:MAG TPA: hypothetical protein VKE98_12950 [Gemmataceae bacterium]|nr:hypothetical protein [Gemmataceae bacterium]